MFKNVAAKFMVFAFDATTNVPKTGDQANITAYVSKDYGTVTVLADTGATEMDATNAPGYYLFDAAQAETNADVLLVSGKSSTANIKVVGAPATIYTKPSLTAGGFYKADVIAISSSTESADRLERTTLAIVTGTCTTGGSATSIIASAVSPTSGVNDQFKGRIITFDKDTTTTALRGQATDITAYTHATLTFTVTALTTAPASGDTFTIT